MNKIKNIKDSFPANQTLRMLLSLAECHGNNIGLDKCPSNGEMVSKPLADRVKRSKFTTILERMTDEELKVTATALLFNKNVQEAVKCFHRSVANYVQVASLAE